jgi:hypothetical protein
MGSRASVATAVVSIILLLTGSGLPLAGHDERMMKERASGCDLSGGEADTAVVHIAGVIYYACRCISEVCCIYTLRGEGYRHDKERRSRDCFRVQAPYTHVALHVDNLQMTYKHDKEGCSLQYQSEHYLWNILLC